MTTIFNGLDWQQVASVTYGGKPYFWVAFPVVGEKRVKYSVVWDRNARCWTVAYDDYSTPVPHELGHFDNPHHARLCAWEHITRQGLTGHFYSDKVEA